MFDAPPGPVAASSPPAAKVAFFAALFAARADVYALRWENARSGKSGWMPAVRGGWRRGVPSGQREYLPLTEEVLTAHLSGEIEVGLYPLLDGDRCWWLAADFDGPAAMLDALAYLKAARAVGAPVALEVSRSGAGAHCLAVLHLPRPRRAGTPGWQWAAPGGDRAARPDEPGQLRPAVPLPRRPTVGRAGEPDRCTVARTIPAPRHDGLSGSGDPGAS